MLRRDSVGDFGWLGPDGTPTLDRLWIDRGIWL